MVFPVPHLHSAECTTKHVTPVCEVKSSSRQIYVHEGHRPSLIYFTTISPTLHVQMLQISVASLLWWRMSHIKKCTIGINFEAHGSEHANDWWILTCSQYVWRSCTPTRNATCINLLECDFLFKDNRMYYEQDVKSIKFMNHYVMMEPHVTRAKKAIKVRMPKSD